MSHLPSRFLLVCLLPLAASSPVSADEYDAFNFRAGAGTLRDDNIFRVPSGQKPQSDTINTTLAGIDFNRRFSLQQLSASITWVNQQYWNHHFLNSDAVNYTGRWLWEIGGSHLHGELAADRSEVQNSFAEVRNFSQRNMRVGENQRFNVEYDFHPSWHLVGSLSHHTVTNEQLTVAENDIEANGAGIGLRYVPASGNSVSWLAKQYDGRYLKRPFDPVLQFDKEFTQPSQEFTLDWQITGHSAVNGRMEYIQRKHEHFSDRDYSGWAGQVGYSYQYSGKTRLSATYLRALTNYQNDLLSSYYVGDELVLAANWAATDKIGVGVHVDFGQRQYRGELAPLPAGMPRRHDEIFRLGGDLAYQPTRWLEVKAGLAMERRNSNDDSQDFTDRKATLSLNARF